MDSDRGGTNPEAGDAPPNIEPDLSRAPPPPPWQSIALPKPLPGSLPVTKGGGGKVSLSPGWELYGLATEFIVFILVFTGIGWAVDRYAGTGKIGVMVGSLLGIVLGVWRLIRGATAAMNRK